MKIRTNEQMRQDLIKLAKSQILRDKLEGKWEEKGLYNWLIDDALRWKVTTELYKYHKGILPKLLKQLREEIDPQITMEELKGYLLWETQQRPDIAKILPAGRLWLEDPEKSPTTSKKDRTAAPHVRPKPAVPTSKT